MWPSTPNPSILGAILLHTIPYLMHASFKLYPAFNSITSNEISKKCEDKYLKLLKKL